MFFKNLFYFLLQGRVSLSCPGWPQTYLSLWSSWDSGLDLVWLALCFTNRKMETKKGIRLAPGLVDSEQHLIHVSSSFLMRLYLKAYLSINPQAYVRYAPPCV